MKVGGIFSLLGSSPFSLLSSLLSSLFSRFSFILSFLSYVFSLLAILLFSSYWLFSTSLLLSLLFIFQVVSLKEEKSDAEGDVRKPRDPDDLQQHREERQKQRVQELRTEQDAVTNRVSHLAQAMHNDAVFPAEEAKIEVIQYPGSDHRRLRERTEQLRAENRRLEKQCDRFQEKLLEEPAPPSTDNLDSRPDQQGPALDVDEDAPQRTTSKSGTQTATLEGRAHLSRRRTPTVIH